MDNKLGDSSNRIVYLSSHKKTCLLLIALLSVAVAYLDNVTSPEVPTDSFYALPIWLGLLSFGLPGGLLVSTTSIILYYISNYLLSDTRNPNTWTSLVLSYSFFLLFCFGAYRFLLNQRQLHQTRHELQDRLKELNRLYNESQLLHQKNLKLVVTEERNRLAREIHDVLAQGFTAIIMQVEAAHLNSNDPAVLEQRLAKINELAHHNLKEARHSVANLRPFPLEGSSLIEGLERQVQEFSETNNPAIQAFFTRSGQGKPLSSETEAGLYRITQEALTNAVRHSQATRVEVTLDFDEDEVCLTVQDNGRGFETAAATIVEADPDNLDERNRKTYGLSMIQERAGLIRGWATIYSHVGEGCRIRVIVPYSKAQVHSGRVGNIIMTEPAVETQVR